MKTEAALEAAAFESELNKWFQRSSSSPSVQKIREGWWNRFLELGLPTKQNESFRPLKLRKLFSELYLQAGPSSLSKEEIASFVFPECRNSVIVFVNGYFVPELCSLDAVPSRVVLKPLEQAVHTYGALLSNYATAAVAEESDPFVALNGALHPRGAFLYLPPKTVIEPPLQILHLIDSRQGILFCQPKLFFFGGAHTETKLLLSQQPLNEQVYFVNQLLDLSLEEGAQLNLTQLHGTENASAWHLGACRAQLKKNSHLETLLVTTGAASVRNSYQVKLGGEGAEAQLKGLSLLANARESHISVRVDHQSPHCRSHQLFKGVLTDVSRSSFEGKIFVHSPAQKTEAFQQNQYLLLDDRAQAYSRPGLEVFADDVKASHGATVGQLDEDQLFYMRARGIPTREAKNLLVSGFCKDLLEGISLSSVKENWMEVVEEYVK